MTTYRQRLKTMIFRECYDGDPWMTDAQRKQLLYELTTTVGRTYQIGTSAHELLVQEPKAYPMLDAYATQAAVYTYGMKASGLVSLGSCRDEEELRLADRDCNAYEKQMGW